MYRRRQIGWPILALLGLGVLAEVIAACVLLTRPGALQGDGWRWAAVMLASALLLVAVMVLFGSLTVTVSPEVIGIAFGPGLIRKRWRISDIRSCQPVRNSLLLGWGIHWFPGGWVFNVSGFDAVELELHNKRRYRIGTDEPSQLTEVIDQQLKQTV